MEIPPGFDTAQTKGKALRLKKSLYGLKQSPRAWFDRFRWVMCNMGYRQCNGDHTIFYHHSNNWVTILAVYVDDIIITGDDTLEIARLKKNLSKEFEVKDLIFMPKTCRTFDLFMSYKASYNICRKCGESIHA